MSKKKSTLNDLEEFLKLQASSLVTPSSLGEKVKETPAVKTEPAVATETASASTPVTKDKLTEKELISAIHELAVNKKDFYQFITTVVETLPAKSTEDTLLINTALYLQGGSNWKEVVRDYWRNKE